jgi:hypothetical protein
MYGLLKLKPEFSVPNPKDSVGKSIDNIRALPDFYRATAAFLKVDFFDEEPQDVVDASGCPSSWSNRLFSLCTTYTMRARRSRRRRRRT